MWHGCRWRCRRFLRSSRTNAFEGTSKACFYNFAFQAQINTPTARAASAPEAHDGTRETQPLLRRGWTTARKGNILSFGFGIPRRGTEGRLVRTSLRAARRAKRMSTMMVKLRLAARMSRLGTESAFEVLVRARELEARGQEIILHETGEPDFPTAPHIVEAAAKALADGWTHYGPPAGQPELREAIAEDIA